MFSRTSLRKSVKRSVCREELLFGVSAQWAEELSAMSAR